MLSVDKVDFMIRPLNYIPGILFIFYSIFSDFTGVISMRYYMCLVVYCQCRLNSALESCGTGVLTGVIVLAVYVPQIND